MKALAIGAVALAGIVSGLGSCQGGPDPAALAELEDAQARWEQADLHDYRLQLRFLCFCPEEIVAPVIVTVEDDVVTAVEWAEPEHPEGDPPQERPTVDGLFEIAGNAIRSADGVGVTYDPQYGYPLSLSIDPDEDVNDDEGSYTAVLLGPEGAGPTETEPPNA
ncbi:MAG: DUF6174 domain-containing protein [Thermoleophilia bacterium]